MIMSYVTHMSMTWEVPKAQFVFSAYLTLFVCPQVRTLHNTMSPRQVAFHCSFIIGLQTHVKYMFSILEITTIHKITPFSVFDGPPKLMPTTTLNSEIVSSTKSMLRSTSKIHPLSISVSLSDIHHFPDNVL